LVAVFSQRLLKTNDGTWVRIEKEILIKKTAIENFIRENYILKILSLFWCFFSYGNYFRPFWFKFLIVFS
jgi:Tfp pilus assembly pilus retraction ATPase PilT